MRSTESSTDCVLSSLVSDTDLGLYLPDFAPSQPRIEETEMTAALLQEASSVPTEETQLSFPPLPKYTAPPVFRPSRKSKLSAPLINSSGPDLVPPLPKYDFPPEYLESNSQGEAPDRRLPALPELMPPLPKYDLPPEDLEINVQEEAPDRELPILPNYTPSPAFVQEELPKGGNVLEEAKVTPLPAYAQPPVYHTSHDQVDNNEYMVPAFSDWQPAAALQGGSEDTSSG